MPQMGKNHSSHDAIPKQIERGITKTVQNVLAVQLKVVSTSYRLVLYKTHAGRWGNGLFAQKTFPFVLKNRLIHIF